MDSQPHSPIRVTHRLTATPVSDHQTRFQVWAPKAKRLAVELVDRQGEVEAVVVRHPLQRNKNGVFTGVVNDCPAGALYRYQLDDQPARPDPRSRFQPFGVHGPSQVIDPDAFCWSDEAWRGIEKRDLVIYELHVGSFSPSGTYAGAIARLDELKQLGITAIELLPLAQSPGRWNWGYDGVNYFAPRNTFGSPDDLKAFVDACHDRQIAVINDVVYNHVGPEGNYLSEFGVYRSKKHGTPWGDAFNFDAAQVRQFVIDNVLFWIDEYHFDGLRLDAVHYMFDDQPQHILHQIQEEFRRYAAACPRRIYLIGETNIYDAELVGDVAGERPHYDAIWSDCLMHSIYTLGNPDLRLTDRHYVAADVAEALEHAYVFSTPQAIRVNSEHRLQNHPTGDRQYISSLIMALQTHDSVGNHPHGKRIHQLTSLEYQMAAAPLFLLYPSIPMIFMGEEWAAEAPFPFFADFEDPQLRRSVDRGRRDEYPHHDWNGSPLPSDPIAFQSTRTTAGGRKADVYRWYQSLLKFRKTGVQAGWLSVDNMTTLADEERQLYRLVYEHPEGTLSIGCRLDRSTGSSFPISDLNVQRILFDSRAANAEATEPEYFEGEHCLIWLVKKGVRYRF